MYSEYQKNVKYEDDIKTILGVYLMLYKLGSFTTALYSWALMY